MNRLPVAIAITCGALAAAYAPTARSASPSISPKHQLANLVTDCMKKRMYSDQSISYNEAARLCKEQVHRQIGNPTSDPLVAADTSPKR